MQRQTRGIIEMVVAMTISGTIGLFVLVSGLPVLQLVFWRCLFAAIALGMSCWFLGVVRVRLTPRQWLLAIAGGGALVCNWALIFGALVRTSISVAMAGYYVQPFILLGLGAVFFREKVTVAKIAYLTIALIGLCLVVRFHLDTVTDEGRFLVGIVMALGVAACWAIAAITTKQLAAVPSQLIAFIHVCVGVAALLPFTGFDDLPNNGSSWAILVTIGVIHTGLVYIIMYDAIGRLETHLQGAISYVNAVIGVFVDVFYFHNRLTTGQLLGMVAILGAALAMTVGKQFRSPLKAGRQAGP